ncbi:MAG: plasmid pRiA4b ORF-3 family protein [Planctomycetaceae bacterium]
MVPATGERFTFRYEYDFGDSWNHEVTFEGIHPAKPQHEYPLCVKGERACPPEDCGGFLGYFEILEACRDPKHAEHKTVRKWLGGPFDPEKFDAAAASAAMKLGVSD